MSKMRATRNTPPIYLSAAAFPFSPHLLSQLYDTAEDANENISIHAPLVRLVDDDDGVLREQEVRRELAQENAVRHELDGRGRSDRRVVSDLVRDARGRQ